MNAKELRRKLQAETEHSISEGGYVDEEVGMFLDREFALGQIPRGATPHNFWSESMQLLSDEELMFRWAVFKM